MRPDVVRNVYFCGKISLQVRSCYEHEFNVNVRHLSGESVVEMRSSTMTRDVTLVCSLLTSNIPRIIRKVNTTKYDTQYPYFLC